MTREIRAAASDGERCRVSQSMERTSVSKWRSISLKLTSALRPELIHALAQSAAPERSSARMRIFRMNRSFRVEMRLTVHISSCARLPESSERWHQKAADNDRCSDKNCG